MKPELVNNTPQFKYSHPGPDPQDNSEPNFEGIIISRGNCFDLIVAFRYILKRLLSRRPDTKHQVLSCVQYQIFSSLSVENNI